MTERRAPLWRPILSWLFLLLFCLAAPVALLTGWARLTATDTESYRRTVSALAADPRVQDAVAQAVTARAETALMGANPTASEAIIARQTAEAVGEATRDVVAGAAFRDAWEEANQQAHGLLMSGMAEGWGQPVVLDFSPLQQPIAAEVGRLGVELPPDFTIDAEDLQIEVLDAASADRIRGAVQRLNVTFWGSLAVSIAALVLSVVLATDRLAALGRAGFGLAIAMAALIGLILVAQAWAVGAAAARGGSVVVGAILEATTQGLRLMAIGLAVGGLAMAGVFTALGAVRRDAARRLREA